MIVPPLALSQISGLGTNVATALAVNIGTAGAPVVNGGALGTPSSGTLSGCSGYPVATTSITGATPIATAPAAGLLSVLAIANGETVRSDKAIFDTTNPAALGTAGPGSQVVAARRDHVHPTAGLPVELVVACSDETTALTAGTAKVTFRMPFAMTLSAGNAGVRASVNTAPVGSTIEVDINDGGTTILSTILSIDASEETSLSAATAVVISDTALADDAEITIDIDQVGSSTAGKGLKVVLRGVRA